MNTCALAWPSDALTQRCYFYAGQFAFSVTLANSPVESSASIPGRKRQGETLVWGGREILTLPISPLPSTALEKSTASGCHPPVSACIDAASSQPDHAHAADHLPTITRSRRMRTSGHGGQVPLLAMPAAQIPRRYGPLWVLLTTAALYATFEGCILMGFHAWRLTTPPHSHACPADAQARPSTCITYLWM